MAFQYFDAVIDFIYHFGKLINPENCLRLILKKKKRKICFSLMDLIKLNFCSVDNKNVDFVIKEIVFSCFLNKKISDFENHKTSSPHV